MSLADWRKGRNQPKPAETGRPDRPDRPGMPRDHKQQRREMAPWGHLRGVIMCNPGRGERIRTSGLYVPNHAQRTKRVGVSLQINSLAQSFASVRALSRTFANLYWRKTGAEGFTRSSEEVGFIRT